MSSADSELVKRSQQAGRVQAEERRRSLLYLFILGTGMTSMVAGGPGDLKVFLFSGVMAIAVLSRTPGNHAEHFHEDEPEVSKMGQAR